MYYVNRPNEAKDSTKVAIMLEELSSNWQIYKSRIKPIKLARPHPTTTKRKKQLS